MRLSVHGTRPCLDTVPFSWSDHRQGRKGERTQEGLKKFLAETIGCVGALFSEMEKKRFGAVTKASHSWV